MQPEDDEYLRGHARDLTGLGFGHLCSCIGLLSWKMGQVNYLIQGAETVLIKALVQKV